MFRKQIKFFITIFVMFFYLLFVGGDVLYAQGPTVKLIVNPNKTDVLVGSDPVALTAKATGTGLQFTWELQGPGRIEGAGSAIFYYVPETVDGKSAQAMVTVTVKDEAGQETTETYTFNILAKEEGPLKPVTEDTSQPQLEKKGMSRNTKIALGAGAAAAVAGVAIMAFSGGDDDGDKPPFSGTFTRESTSVTNTGRQTFWTETYTLTQSGNAITGTLAFAATLPGCCTASFSVPVSGTANGNSAILTEGSGEAICQCPGGGTYHPSYTGGTYNVTLINNGSVLRFEGGAEFTRTSKVQNIDQITDAEEDVLFRAQGDFWRK